MGIVWLNISVHKKLYWNTAMIAHLHPLTGFFHSTVAKLISWEKSDGSQTQRHLLPSPSSRTFTYSWINTSKFFTLEILRALTLLVLHCKPRKRKTQILILSKLFGILSTPHKIHEQHKTFLAHEFRYLLYHRKVKCVICLLTEYLIIN